MADTPEPGTREARVKGCICGVFVSRFLDSHIINRDRDCPLHGIDPDRAREDADERKRLAREDNDG